MKSILLAVLFVFSATLLPAQDSAPGENPILKELADLTGTLEMEEADEADANILNYVLERWVSTQGRLNCCK